MTTLQKSGPPAEDTGGGVDIGAAVDCLLLRAQTVAKWLDISTSKVYQMMQSGQLPTIRIGKSLRVPRKALENWIVEQTKPGVLNAA